MKTIYKDRYFYFLPLLFGVLGLLLSFRVNAVETPLTSPLQKIFPTASHIDSMDKDAAIVPVYRLNQLQGYAFRTAELAPVRGYGGKPIDLMIGLDTDGRYTGITSINHHEPIFLKGSGPAKLQQYLDQLIGAPASKHIYLRGNSKTPKQGAKNVTNIDGISSATVTTHAINKTIYRSAKAVAQAKELAGYTPVARLIPDTSVDLRLSLQELIDRGLVKYWPIYERQIQSAKEAKRLGFPSQPLAIADQPPMSEIYIAYLNHPLVSKNILSEKGYSQWSEQISGIEDESPDQYILLLYRGQTQGSKLDSTLILQQRRINLVNQPVEFSPYSNQLIPALQDFSRIELLKIPAVANFDPTLRTNLIFTPNPKTRLKDSYQIPKHYFKVEQSNITPELPLWQQLWQQRQSEIAILFVSLLVLSVLFIKQHEIAGKSPFFYPFRWGFLVFTLGYIGFYAQGQLSIVNVLTLQHLLLDGTSLDLFLLDPVTCILWIFVLASLVLFGRGLFCGWLCPFGALQELCSALAKRLKIKPMNIQPAWHTRLQKLKFLIFGVIVTTSFYSLAMAELLAELEPFKTVTTLFFIRDWQYVLYALVVILASMKIHKLYCRYLCPLGAGFALVGAFPIFNWLTRRKECGTPCQSCRRQCEIDAIAVSGEIDMKECIQCLECLVIYENPDRCAIDIAAVKKQRLYDRRQQLLIAKAD